MKRSNNNKETRFFGTQYEVRTEGDENTTIAGTAAVFNQETVLYSGKQFELREKIVPGAFDKVLRENQDVRALKNHDSNLILARTANNTLSLNADGSALNYSFEAPETTAGRDTLIEVKSGLINQSSFGFTIAKEDYQETEQEGRTIATYTIREIDRLFDVGPVTFPAYPSTSARSADIERLKAEHEERKAKAENVQTVLSETEETSQSEDAGKEGRQRERYLYILENS